MCLRILMVALLLAGALVGFAQKKNAAFEYRIKPAASAIKVDGKPDEAAWQNAATVTDFFQVLPMDTSAALVRTDVKLTYDEHNLYVLCINYNRVPGPFVVESMKRDFAFNNNDNNLLFLDTFDDQTNGFSFGSNAMGGQWDGLMSNGARIDLSWDNRWHSETSHDAEKWVWEAAIPFRTLRYKAGITRWGINFSRLDLKANEKSAWAPVPRQFPTASLAYTGYLIWDTPPPKPGANIALIPYVTAGSARNFEKNQPGVITRNIGMDAKIGLTSSLNLDLTVNPDFSQVEVDVQQTNLDRFELFFPERRQFFIENGDLFANFGYANLRPFFSRRVGLNAPLLYGAKLGGKVTKNLRIGALNAQTGTATDGLPGSNYTVLTAQQQVLARSNISAILVNRQTTGKSETSLADYNRTAGVEFNLLSKDNLWIGKVMALKTFSPQATGSQNHVLAGNIERLGRRLGMSMQTEWVGAHVTGNETGFIRRRDYFFASPRVSYNFFPQSKKLITHGPSVFASYYYPSNFNGPSFEYVRGFSYNASFLDRSELSVWSAEDYVTLNTPFDPTNFSGYRLAAGTQHTWRSGGINYTSSPKRRLTYSVSTRTGGYFADGYRLRLEGTLGYRFQPYVAFVLSTSYNKITFGADPRLPEPLVGTRHNLWLVGPRLDVTFTNKLFLTNFVQFNNQTNNVNINTRFQWRYSPASDLFLVYTDNYFSDNFQVRNRALVLKFTYWWNV